VQQGIHTAAFMLQKAGPLGQLAGAVQYLVSRGRDQTRGTGQGQQCVPFVLPVGAVDGGAISVVRTIQAKDQGVVSPREMAASRSEDLVFKSLNDLSGKVWGHPVNLLILSCAQTAPSG
jgi:hypothetical protein